MKKNLLTFNTNFQPSQPLFPLCCFCVRFALGRFSTLPGLVITIIISKFPIQIRYLSSWRR